MHLEEKKKMDAKLRAFPGTWACSDWGLGGSCLEYGATYLVNSGKQVACEMADTFSLLCCKCRGCYCFPFTGPWTPGTGQRSSRLGLQPTSSVLKMFNASARISLENKNKNLLGAPGWLSRLGEWLLISGLWDQVPCWVERLFKNKNLLKRTTKKIF